jgi:hypothetical protein
MDASMRPSTLYRPGPEKISQTRDQRVQHLGKVQEVVEPGEDAARLDAVDPASVQHQRPGSSKV